MARPGMWMLLLASSAFCLVGCQSRAPFFNPLAPYGSPRVDPPATGSYSAPDAYYPTPALPNTAPPVGSTSRNSPQNSVYGQPSSTSAVGTGVMPSYAWQPSGTSATRSAATSLADAGGESRVRVVESIGASKDVSTGASTVVATSSLSLERMPVNDATRLSEPGRFAPLGPTTAIGQLPNTPLRNAQLPKPSPRNVSPLGGVSQPASVTVPSAGQSNAAGGASSSMSNGWRLRPATEQPLGVVTR